ncbi:MAG: SpoIIE family protein phosphatase [Desulfobacula sp.]|jgi:serine/threonine protein phosphatase PrpC|nr:SpoIIE family protein phosphatase [Desulfobacula sp.]
MYLLHHNKIKQITTDHTFIQDLLDDGTLTPDQARTHPLKNVLDQCVGCDEFQPDTGVFNIEKNDRLLLCSDGLTMHLSDVQIELVLKTKSLQKAGQQMIQTALKRGGADNVTVIVKDFY